MEKILRFRGKNISSQELAAIQTLLAEHPNKSRRSISRLLCEQWNWRQPNGYLKDMLCRSLLLRLEEQGLIQLPPRRCQPWLWRRSVVSAPQVQLTKTPMPDSLPQLQPIQIIKVARRSDSYRLYKNLIQHHHYLGFTTPVGEHLEYLFYSQERPIACIGWCSSPRHIGCRDRFLGWNQTHRQRALHRIIVNTRFLILPGIKVPNLASWILGTVARRIARDWQEVYAHLVFFLETFVDETKGFRGTCYRAANWIYLGQTTGRGKNDHTHCPNRSRKLVFGYPLVKNYQEALYGDLL
ncbi:DUF4338 domain-containing protein [bacterium]|nr:DUF4338 domain-containing protein [bacterium]